VKPTVKIASAQTPDGESLELYGHEEAYSIRVNRQELMTSRANESERELARLGCARIKGHPKPVVLIGGLGMGFTLRETLDLLNPRATVIVGELMPEIVDWNRRYFGELADHPLRDARVTLKLGDVMRVIRTSPHTFDAILLDVDNGPEAFTVAGNDALYSREGIEACWLPIRHLKDGCVRCDSRSVAWRFRPTKGRVRCRAASGLSRATRRHCPWRAPDRRAYSLKPFELAPDEGNDARTPEDGDALPR